MTEHTVYSSINVNIAIQERKIDSHRHVSAWFFNAPLPAHHIQTHGHSFDIVNSNKTTWLTILACYSWDIWWDQAAPPPTWKPVPTCQSTSIYSPADRQLRFCLSLRPFSPPVMIPNTPFGLLLSNLMPYWTCFPCLPDFDFGLRSTLTFFTGPASAFGFKHNFAKPRELKMKKKTC